jgi:hypothetical protein
VHRPISREAKINRAREVTEAFTSSLLGGGPQCDTMTPHRSFPRFPILAAKRESSDESP